MIKIVPLNGKSRPKTSLLWIIKWNEDFTAPVGGLWYASTSPSVVQPCRNLTRFTSAVWWGCLKAVDGGSKGLGSLSRFCFSLYCLGCEKHSRSCLPYGEQVTMCCMMHKLVPGPSPSHKWLGDHSSLPWSNFLQWDLHFTQKKSLLFPSPTPPSLPLTIPSLGQPHPRSWLSWS